MDPVERCRDYLQGSCSAEELREALRGFQEGLEEVLAGFEEAAASQPQHLRARCREEVEGVRRGFAECREIAGGVEKALEPPDPAELTGVVRRLEQAIRDLDRALAAYREAVLVAVGPTPIPGANLVVSAVRGYLEGGEPVERLEDPLRREMLQTARLVEACQSAFRAPLENYLRALEHLAAAAVEGMRAGIAAALQSFQAAAEALGEARASPASLAEAAGPLPPRVEHLVGMAGAVWEGGASAEEWGAATEEMRVELQSLQARLTSMAEGVASEMVREEAGKAGALLAGCQQALEELSIAAVEGPAGRLREACRRLGRAFQALGESRQRFEELADIEGKTPCIQCGHYNPAERSTCEKCAAVLPVAAREQARALDLREGAEASPEPPLEMTENLQRILRAVEQFSSGTLAAEDFRAEVSWMEGLVKAARRLLPQEAEASPELEWYLQGLEELESGLASLARACDPTPAVGLEAGVQLLLDGAARIQSVRRRLEETRGAGPRNGGGPEGRPPLGGAGA